MMEISVQKRRSSLYYWQYTNTDKIHDKNIVCTSHNHWKTKKACIRNAIVFSKSLKLPAPVVDCTLKYIMPWAPQGIKFNP